MSRLTAKQRQENEEIKQEFLDYAESQRIQKLKAKRHAAGVKGHLTRRRNMELRKELGLTSDIDKPDNELSLKELMRKYPQALDTPPNEPNPRNPPKSKQNSTLKTPVTYP